VFPNGFIEAVNAIAVGDEEIQEAVKKAKTHDFIQEHLLILEKINSVIYLVIIQILLKFQNLIFHR
jgi:ABC-type multidrug transport system fused ATPase/permease subunit